jgi:acyl-coenzyme A synthetase/AMP-(fatty) acid ligase
MHGERHLTYSELNEEVERFARGLMSTGIGKGDPVTAYPANACNDELAQSPRW